MELVCPAGSPAALQAALDNGADAIYVGINNRSNARAFPGLNFTPDTLATACQQVHSRGRKIYLALNTYPQSPDLPLWKSSLDAAAEAGVDAFIIAEMAMLAYASKKHDHIPRHLSVQGSATNAASLQFYHEQFGICRAVLPRVLSLQQVQRLAAKSPVALEVFAFGSLCIMVEGRCQLSSHVTGKSPNCDGVCSPAEHVHWEELGNDRRRVRLGEVLIDEFQPGEAASYPTVCKGRYAGEDDRYYYALEEPTSLNTISLLPELAAAGIAAVKIEGRQRGPAYVGRVASVWRQALDACQRDATHYIAKESWQKDLQYLAEGRQTTLGPYHRDWH
ncbi:MAG: U32 family peptidase [Pseudomonadales bacterium]|nr:U32 family peptidase [Pseudomonadales bacterium]